MTLTFLERLRAPFAWVTVRLAGRHVYQENLITGRRRALPRAVGGHQPLDHTWLQGGEFDIPVTRAAPPRSGSGVKPPSRIPDFSGDLVPIAGRCGSCRHWTFASDLPWGSCAYLIQEGQSPGTGPAFGCVNWGIRR